MALSRCSNMLQELGLPDPSAKGVSEGRARSPSPAMVTVTGPPAMRARAPDAMPRGFGRLSSVLFDRFFHLPTCCLSGSVSDLSSSGISLPSFF